MSRSRGVHFLVQLGRFFSFLFLRGSLASALRASGELEGLVRDALLPACGSDVELRMLPPACGGSPGAAEQWVKVFLFGVGTLSRLIERETQRRPEASWRSPRPVLPFPILLFMTHVGIADFR